MSDFTIETRPNAYGFGSDWTLVHKPSGRSWFMGQAAKVCARFLGFQLQCLPEVMREWIRENDIDSLSISTGEVIAYLVVEAFGGIEAVLGSEAWGLHAGGG